MVKTHCDAPSVNLRPRYYKHTFTPIFATTDFQKCLFSPAWLQLSMWNMRANIYLCYCHLPDHLHVKDLTGESAFLGRLSGRGGRQGPSLPSPDLSCPAAARVCVCPRPACVSTCGWPGAPSHFRKILLCLKTALKEILEMFWIFLLIFKSKFKISWPSQWCCKHYNQKSTRSI